jgi:hypothetical protein
MVVARFLTECLALKKLLHPFLYLRPLPYQRFQGFQGF